MRDDGAVACHKFRNRVTECGALAHRDIVLNYGGLALFLSHNQVARMAHERRVRRSRNEQQENRIFDDCALADMYVRSVLGKGGDVSKPPILVVGGRETYFAETCEGILAEPPQPWQVAPSRAFLEFSEAFQVGFQLLGRCDHVLPRLKPG